jgi:chloride channel protein, CIC family
LSAIFRSPIGTAIFAIEVLYADMEFEAGALFYTMLGSVVAYAFNGLVVGWEPLFRVPKGLAAPNFMGLAWYAALGIASGLVATMLPVVFYGLRDAFHKLPVPPHVKPAIGGLGIGLMALVLPQVLGGGYGWIQEAIDGHLALGILVALVFAKTVALALTVSSGGSGGSFGPTLFVGAMVGGAMAKVFHEPSAAFVVVGMAAVFGGSARVPIATLLMVTEMTGGYQLLVPAALAVMLSYFIQTSLSRRLKYNSLYESQVPGRGDSPAHHVEHLRIAMDLLEKRSVTSPSVIGHLDLLALLESGIAVDLTEGKQLTIGVLRPESSWVGRPIRLGSQEELGAEMEMVAILRQGEMLLPHPDMLLQAGDRVLSIVSPGARDRLSRHLAPLSS